MIQTVFTLISKGDQFLLIQEGGTARGLWGLAGGHLNEGETLEQGAIREAREEAGVDIELEEKLLVKTITGFEYLGDPAENNEMIEVHVYGAKYKSGEVRSGEEELDAGWFTAEEIKKLKLRLKFITELLI